MRVFFLNGSGDNDVEVILLSADKTIKFSEYPHFRVLRVTKEDLMQFTPIIPSVTTVNGEGKVLFKSVGYKKGLFEQALEVISGQE